MPRPGERLEKNLNYRVPSQLAVTRSPVSIRSASIPPVRPANKPGAAGAYCAECLYTPAPVASPFPEKSKNFTRPRRCKPLHRVAAPWPAEIGSEPNWLLCFVAKQLNIIGIRFSEAPTTRAWSGLPMRQVRKLFLRLHWKGPSIKLLLDAYEIPRLNILYRHCNCLAVPSTECRCKQ